MRRGRIRGAPTAVIAVHTPLLLVGLSGVLGTAEVRIVGMAYNADSAAKLVELLQPDLLISEFAVATSREDRALGERVRGLAPGIRRLALLADDDPQLVSDVVGGGADVYALSDTDPADLAIAIRQLFRQVIFIADDCMHGDDGRPLPLTRRETLILRLVAEGYTNSSVAERLGVSEPTVKFHLTNIFRKLNVGNRTEASSWAREHGLTLRPAPVLEYSAEALGAAG
jgi:DNA-binding NarL/FixJ family response regulator